MTVKEIRDLDKKKLSEKLSEARTKLVRTRFHVANRELKKVREVRALRRDIARMMSVANERTRTNG